MRRLLLPFALMPALAVIAAVPGDAAAAASRQAAEASAKRLQTIGAVKVRPDGERAARVTVKVGYPRVGRGNGEARVRLIVFDSPKRLVPRTRLDFKVAPRPGGVATYSLLVTGPAATRLRRAYRSGQAEKALSVVSFHGRDLAGTRAVDHWNIVSVEGDLARTSPTVPRARAAGSKATLTVYNGANNTAVITATPVTCMYDNGDHGSNVSALNGMTVPAGTGVSTGIQTDAALKDHAGGNMGWDSNAITPAVVDGLYNAETQNLMHIALAGYLTADAANPPWTPGYSPNGGTSGDAWQTVQSDSFPGIECDLVKGLFVVALDEFTQPGGPTDHHAAYLLTARKRKRIENLGGVDSQELSDVDGLQAGFPGGGTISFSENPLPFTNCTPGNEWGPNWMACVLPAGSPEAQVPLTSVVFPGSHDSGTGKLAADSDWLLKNGSTCTKYRKLDSRSPSTVFNAAVTQRYGLRQQLQLGIRYLDARVAYDAGNGDDPGGRWRVVHTMFTQDSTQTEFQQVANWALAHPQEVVILDLNHVCPQGGDTSGLVTAMKTGDPVTGNTLCDVAYFAATPEQIPTLSLDAIRATGQNVIVLLDGKQSYTLNGCGGAPLWDATQNNAAGSRGSGSVPINHLWPENPGPGGCNHDDYDQESAATMTAYPESSSSPGIGNAPPLGTFRGVQPTPFTQSQTQYTPGESGVVSIFFGECGNLQQYESDLIANYRPGIISSWGPMANIIIGDFVDSNYVNQVAGLNP